MTGEISPNFEFLNVVEFDFELFVYELEELCVVMETAKDQLLCSDLDSSVQHVSLKDSRPNCSN